MKDDDIWRDYQIFGVLVIVSMSSSYIFNAFSRLLRKNTQQVYVAMQVSL